MKQPINKSAMGSFTPLFEFEKFLLESGFTEKQYSPLNAFVPFREYIKGLEWVSIGFNFQSNSGSSKFWFTTSTFRDKIFRLPVDRSSFETALNGELESLI